MSVQDVIQQVRQLPHNEQRALMEWLGALLQEEDAEKPYRIWDFEGIASHLADDEDPQDYINRLRDEWHIQM